MNLSSNNFSKDAPAKSENLAEGDNTSYGDMAQDFSTYGDIYGQGRYGGFVHFRIRAIPPTINHT